MNNNQKKSITDTILERVREKRVPMRSRAQLLWGRVKRYVPFIIVGLFALFVASFFFFTLRATGVNELAGFGPEGYWRIARSLPIVLTLSVVALLILTVLLAFNVRAFRRKPLVITFLAVFLMVLVGGGVLAQTTVHDRLTEAAEDGHLPVFGPIYREQMRHRLEGAVIGVVTEIGDDTYEVETIHDEQVRVHLREETRFIRGFVPEVGSMIIIMGERTNGDIDAIDIKALLEGKGPWIMHKGQFPPPHLQRQYMK